MGSTTVKAMVVLVETALKSRLTMAGMVQARMVQDTSEREMDLQIDEQMATRKESWWKEL